MASPILQINFEREEQEIAMDDEFHSQRQFFCKSDASDYQSSGLAEEKSDLPPPPAPASKSRFPSPQKKVTEACRTVYDELRKNLNPRKSHPKPSGDGGEKKQKHSFIRTMADLSGLLDEENERSGSNGSKTRTRKPSEAKTVPAPPPVALKKPADLSDEDIPMARPARVVNPPSQFLDITQNGTSHVVPPPSYPPEEDEVIRPLRKQSSTTYFPQQFKHLNRKQSSTSSARSFDENSRGNKLYESDDGLEPIADEDHSGMPLSEGTFMSGNTTSYYTENNLPRGPEDHFDDDEGGNSYSVKSPGWLHSKLDDTIYGKVAATKWSCSQVSEFLEACGLAMYSRTFAENGVDGSTLLELNHEQIRRGLNVHERLHLLSLELGVELLRQRKIRTVKDWEWSCPRVSEWLEAKGLGLLVSPFKLGAVHGGVLFSLTEDQFVSELGVGKDSVLVLMSLLASIERAREVGPLKHGEEVPDWSPSRVKTWLESLSLAHLVPIFKQFAVNGALLLHLDAQCMRQEMNVTEIQAIVLEKAIHKLRRQQEKHASIWMTTWKRVTMSLWGRKKRLSAGGNQGNKGSFKATTTKQQQSSSLAATYGKYATGGQALRQPTQLQSQTHARKQSHHRQGGKSSQPSVKQQQQGTDGNSNNKMTTPQRRQQVVSQQPVSPAPSRPPRPVQSDSKPKTMARQNTHRSINPNTVEESSMSIL